MERSDLGVWLAIISSKRSANVEQMSIEVGPATWYVAKGEGEAYTRELARIGGTGVVVEGGGLCASRNRALEDGFDQGLAVLEMSDDFRGVERAVYSAAKRACTEAPFTFVEAVAKMRRALRDTGMKLGGVAPTSNAFYSNHKKPIHTRAFVVGDMILVEPSEPRFDEEMTLKEDYDFTLQHIAKYKGVARCDDVLAEFAHRTNPGGAVDYRTRELEQKNIAHLKKKWGSLIQDNPRRPDEILLALRKR